MNSAVQIILYKVERSRPLKYLIVLVTAFFGLSLFAKLFYSLSGSGEIGTGSTLSNSEVNDLLTQGVVNKKERMEFRLQTPYLDNEVSEQNFQFNGQVLIRNNEYVRLTSEKKHMTSSFFSNKKILESSFELDFYFSISGKGDVSKLHGDGMGIFFTTEKLAEGELFGVNEFYKGFAIYIDTYRNGRRGVFPYVMAARNDGSDKYDKDQDGRANEIDGCIARSLWNPVNQLTKGRLIYVQDGYVSLDFDYKNDGHWTNCFTLQDVFLPPDLHVGFSAQTGDLTENVDIIESHLYGLYDYKDEPFESFERLKEILEDESSPDKFEEVSELYQVNDDTRRSRKVNKKKDEKVTRRTLKRLKNAETRLKKESAQRRAERRKRIKETIGSAKYYIYVLVLAVVVYLCTVVYRVQKKAQRRNISGILA